MTINWTKETNDQGVAVSYRGTPDGVTAFRVFYSILDAGWRATVNGESIGGTYRTAWRAKLVCFFVAAHQGT